jgi:hypothetical protein
MDAAATAPPTKPMPNRVRALPRLGALALALACLGVLLAAAWVAPDPAGHGTHERLGLPPCAWEQSFGKPCMTCGMTTAFAHAAHGQLLDSARVQPMGLVLAVLTASIAWGAGHVALTGSTLGAAAQRMLTTRLLWASLGLLLAAWAYKFVTWQG